MVWRSRTARLTAPRVAASSLLLPRELEVGICLQAARRRASDYLAWVELHAGHSPRRRPGDRRTPLRAALRAALSAAQRRAPQRLGQALGGRAAASVREAVSPCRHVGHRGAYCDSSALRRRRRKNPQSVSGTPQRVKPLFPTDSPRVAGSSKCHSSVYRWSLSKKMLFCICP